MKKTIVKVVKKPASVKPAPAATPTEPATTPGTERQQAFDQYAQQCAAADSHKLTRLEEEGGASDNPANQTHAPQSSAATTADAPSEPEQNHDPKELEGKQSEPFGPKAPEATPTPAAKVKTEPAESYLDKTIRVLEKMGYAYEECTNVLSGFDTSAQVDLWAVIDQINEARRTAEEMPMKPADDAMSSQGHGEWSDRNSWDNNAWESWEESKSDWDPWAWKGWDGWGYYRSSSWQSYMSDTVHSPSDKHIQAAMERADTQELDQGTSPVEPGMNNKEPLDVDSLKCFSNVDFSLKGK